MVFFSATKKLVKWQIYGRFWYTLEPERCVRHGFIEQCFT